MNEESRSNTSFSEARYRQLAELRFRIRRFLQQGEQAARTNGIEPQQLQLMLMIKGLPANTQPTVSALANRLCLRHHSTVELINRLVERGAAERHPSQKDKRQVLVALTPAGEALLEQLTTHHYQELKTMAPDFVLGLSALMNEEWEESTDLEPSKDHEAMPSEPLESKPKMSAIAAS